MRLVHPVADRPTAESWLVGSTTYAVDRFVPDVELVYQTAYVRGGGDIVFSIDEQPTTAPAIRVAGRTNRLKSLLRKSPPVSLGERQFIDMRENNYFNWSHHVNHFLLVALMARNYAQGDILVILPTGMPGVLYQAYALFGFETIATDGPVTGRRISYVMSHMNIMETASADMVEANRASIDAALGRIETDKTFEKVFINRKTTRAIENSAEIERLLGAQGYVTIYAETLSAAEQFHLWNTASHVVTIHGAAIAPLRYRQPDHPPIRLVEICPVGHMTRFFRSMCHDVGGHYVGVRGRIKRAYLPDLYRFGKPFLDYSLDGFEVDPRSLELALYLVDGGAMQDDHPRCWVI